MKKVIKAAKTEEYKRFMLDRNATRERERQREQSNSSRVQEGRSLYKQTKKKNVSNIPAPPTPDRPLKSEPTNPRKERNGRAPVM